MTDVNLTGHRTSRAPTDGHEHEGITMSTVVMTDTLHSRYTQEVVIGESESKDVEAAGVKSQSALDSRQRDSYIGQVASHGHASNS